MTGERIVRGILLSAALALGLVGCPPEPPDDDDAGIGGSAPTGGTAATGGRAAGGAATGGKGGDGGMGPVAVCQTVTTLPEQGSSCGNTPGESRCLTNGDRCVCIGTIWYCNNACPSPPPTPGTDCSNHKGAACNYADGATCACMTNQWICVGDSSSCPRVGPTVGDPCTQPGIVCDYPATSAFDLFRILCCMADPVDGSTWTGMILGSCPETQPVYPTTCTSARLCTYGNARCICMSGGNWICDWPMVFVLMAGIPE